MNLDLRPRDFVCALYGETVLPKTLYQGKLVSVRLERVAELFPEWHPLTETLRQAARIIRAGSDLGRTALTLSQTDKGLVSVRSLWAVLLTNQERTLATPADTIRALLLIRVWEEPDREELRALAEILNAFVKRWEDSEKLPPCARALALKTFLRYPSLGYAAAREELAQVITLHGKAHMREAAISLLAIARDHLVITEDKRRNQPDVKRARRRAAMIDGGPEVIETVDSKSLLLSEISETPLRSSDVARKTIRSGQIMLGSLISGADTALDPDESRDVFRRLDAISTSDASWGPLSQCALVVELTFITSNGFRDVLASLASFREGHSNLFIRQGSRVILRRACPYDEEKFARIERREGMPETAGEALVPLPQVISDRIIALIEAPCGLISYDQFAIEFNALAEELRSVTPRISEGRVRLSVPIAAVDDTDGDVGAVQMLGSQALGPSTAPLAYYARSESDYRADWCRLVELVTGLSIDPASIEASTRWIGAPIATLPDSAFLELTPIYRAELEAAYRSGDLIQIHDGLSRYCARLFLAASTFRGFDDIGEICIGAIDPRGLCVGRDKPSDTSPGIRACVLAEMFIRVAEDLIAIRRQLARVTTDDTRTCLHEWLEPDGPLFCLVATDEGPRQIRQADIAPPPHTGLPVNVWRSRMRTRLTAKGVFPRLVYSQLGWVWNGHPPFGHHSTESLLEAARTLGPVMDELLRADGWAHVPLPKNLQGALDVGFPRLTWDCVQRSRINSAPSGSLGCRRTRFNVEQRNKHDESVTEFLLPLEQRTSELEPVARDICLTKELVNDLVNATVERWGHSSASTQACLRSIRARVIWNQRRFGWTGMLPPLAVEPPQLPPEIEVHHLQAARIATQLRDAVTAARSFDGRIDAESRILRLAVILILDRRVLNAEQLWSVLEEIASTGPHEGQSQPRMPGYIEIPDESGRRMVALQRDASILVAHLHGTPLPSRISAERYIRREVEDCVGPINRSAISTLLDIASLASRVECPGVDWAIIDRGDHGTLGWARTVDWIYDQCGGAHLMSTAPEDPVAVSLRQRIHSLPHQPERKRYELYKNFRLALHKLSEPGASERGVPDRRFAKARALIADVCVGESADRVVTLLATYALEFFRNGRTRTRIATAYKAMTLVGRRLLLHLGNRDLLSLNEDELALVYSDIVDSAVDISKVDLAHGIRRFHHFSAAALPSIDENAAIGKWLQSSTLTLNVRLVNNSERLHVETVFEDAVTRGLMSNVSRADRTTTLRLMARHGLRAGEVTHARQKDHHIINGRPRLYVHSSSLGFVKSEAGRRSIDLMLSDVTVAPPVRRRGSAPLIGADLRGPDLRVLLADLRETLVVATGDPQISLHALRHAAISRTIAAIRSEPHKGRDMCMRLAKATRLFGQADYSTPHFYYSHLAHLDSISFEATIPSWPELSALTGIDSATLRKRASRATPGSPDTSSGFAGRQIVTNRLRATPFDWPDTSLAAPPPPPEFGTYRAPMASPEDRVTQNARFICLLHRFNSIDAAHAHTAMTAADVRQILGGLFDLRATKRLVLIPDAVSDYGAVGYALPEVDPAVLHLTGGPPDRLRKQVKKDDSSSPQDARQVARRVRTIVMSRNVTNAFRDLRIRHVPERVELALSGLLAVGRKLTRGEESAIAEVQAAINWSGWLEASAETRETILLTVAVATYVTTAQT